MNAHSRGQDPFNEKSVNVLALPGVSPLPSAARHPRMEAWVSSSGNRNFLAYWGWLRIASQMKIQELEAQVTGAMQ